MDLNQISAVVGVLGALAVASERLVEIVKKFFPWLDKDNPALSDKWREFWLHVLAVGCGMVTVWLCSAAVKDIKGLAEISTQEELKGDYFNIFLRLTGMADDLAILFPVEDGATLGLVFERVIVRPVVSMPAWRSWIETFAPTIVPSAPSLCTASCTRVRGTFSTR